MKNVPKLRFKGFSDEWEVKTVEDIFDKIKNPVVVEKDKEYRQIGIRSHGKGIFYKEAVTGEELGNKRVFWIEPDVFIVNIVFAWERAIARTTEDEVGMIASHRFPMYKPKKELLDLDFITYFFKTKKGQNLLELASPGGAGRNKTLGQKEFDNVKVKLPTVEEQEKIANFLTKVDKLIEKQDEKVNKLEQYKKGIIQKIFSQEIRVKKDDEGEYPEWTVKKLNEVADKFDYGMNSAAIEFDGENKYIRITDIDESSNKYKKNNLVSPQGDLDEKYLVEENDILFARTGASVGKTYLYDKNDGKLYFAGFLIRAKIKKENNAKFIFLQTQTNKYKKWVEIMSMRSGQPGINSQEYATLQVNIPYLEEQNKIANFLSKIDLTMEKEKERLEELLNWKKGLLQQMFM